MSTFIVAESHSEFHYHQWVSPLDLQCVQPLNWTLCKHFTTNNPIISYFYCGNVNVTFLHLICFLLSPLCYSKVGSSQFFSISFPSPFVCANWEIAKYVDPLSEVWGFHCSAVQEKSEVTSQFSPCSLLLTTLQTPSVKARRIMFTCDTAVVRRLNSHDMSSTKLTP